MTRPGIRELLMGPPPRVASDAGADGFLHQISPRGEYVLGTRPGPGPDVLFLAHVATGDVVATATGFTLMDEQAFGESESRVLAAG